MGATLASRRSLARLVGRAVFRRAVKTWGAERVAAAAPRHLAEIANAIAADPGGGLAARPLVRDALLQGHELYPTGFLDPEVCDVLAEDRPPVWLACLGVVRRVWPVTSRPQSDPGGGDAGPPAGGGQARRFWYWLQVAESSGATREDVHEARKHMKRLDEGLHALYMRRAR